MIVIERTVDLSQPIQTDVLKGNEFRLEQNAHTFRIHVTDGGEPVTLTGSVDASMLLADGNGLTLQGTLEDGTAVLTLPQAAYMVPGRFMLAIYSLQVGETASETVKTCIYACVGAVVNTYGKTQYDPGHIIPDAETLAAYIEACQEATDAANAAAEDAETAMNGAVRFDTAQTLTDAQKAQARANIGAADAGQVSAIHSLVYYGSDNTLRTGTDDRGPITATVIGGKVTLNGSKTTQSGSLRVRLYGPVTTRQNANPTAEQNISGGIQLKAGREYKIFARLVSGSYTMGEGATVPWCIQCYTAGDSGGAISQIVIRDPAYFVGKVNVTTNTEGCLWLYMNYGDSWNNAVIQVWVEDAQAAYDGITVPLADATQTITALSGVRYVCTASAVTELSFTPCAYGLCSVRFVSGSTPTLLTLPNTVKMPSWWAGCAANTTYEISIEDGIYGAVGVWT